MNVLLTGGSRGIGAATVRALHAAGHSVAFTYNTDRKAADRISRELGDRALAYRCDLARADTLPALVETVAGTLGSIEALVNNAAIFEWNPFFGGGYDAWRAGWERTFAINVFGAVNLTYLVLQHMREQGGGRVVNIVSRSSHRGEIAFPDYGASKAALNNLTKSIARACARDGIVSIAIAPGFIATDMAARELRERRAEIEAEIPGGRVGTPDEVAAIVAFFCSGAGDYANGATIDLNGGSYLR